MRVLIISGEVWQDDTNGGNVLSNIFQDTEYEFAQIYCNPGTPQNTLCKRYYQMTDSMVICSFFRHAPIGKIVLEEKEQTVLAIEQPNKQFYSFFKKHKLGVFYLAKAMVWNLSNWKNEKLREFVTDFDPDIIFAPCYGNTFMLRLTRYIASICPKRIISYISDDSYTLHQFSLSPYFWLSRFAVRAQLRKTFPYYSLVYTMTETQKEQCERDFGANMKILLKAVPFGDIPDKTNVGSPIRLIYAGGIYLNRWKTLASVAEAIRNINRVGVKIQLHIFTGNELSSEMNKVLNDGKNSIVHGTVSQEELAKEYHKSDIALHAESFDLKYRLAVRMSFSTKIVDCLSSGCAVMAICEEKQGGYVYLEQQDAAICISNCSSIYSKLQFLVDNPSQIIEYAKKAKLCCERNHDRERVTSTIKMDFDIMSRNE